MNENFDFVVVGSGGGSLCAALVLRAQGKSVVILEKMPQVGGTTSMSGGVMWIPNNRYMKAAGIPDSREQALAYLDAVVGDDTSKAGATRARRAAYVDQAPAMLEFLISRGLKFRRLPSYPDYYDAAGSSEPGRTVVAELFDLNQLGEWKSKLRPGFLPVPANLDEAMLLPYLKRMGAAKKAMLKIIGRTLVSKLRGKHLATAGTALQASMLHAALKAGTDIRVNAPVKQLIVENGRVVGVVVDDNGTEKRIGARLGVLLNAGGFARNQRMRDQYLPGTSADWSNTSLGDTGEMIEEGLRIGAAVAQMDEFVGHTIVPVPGKPAMLPSVQNEVPKPHTIIVDQTGERYMNEAASYVDLCKGMLERNQRVPAVPSWMVLDSQYINTYMLAGTMPGAKKPQAWFDAGILKRGETIEELAKACGMDPAKLKATVERFNGFVRQGRDEDFNRGGHAFGRWLGDPIGKPSTTLGTLEQGPFYALQFLPGDVSTSGGLVTDEHARVLRADGSPIAGLYATGSTAATVMGNRTPGAGASVGPSLVWGYVAAKHALAQDNQSTEAASSGNQPSNPIGARSAVSH